MDVFFLDVEGAELKVLETITWTTERIDIVVVEKDSTNHHKNEMVKDMLTKIGFITPFDMLGECTIFRPGQNCMPISEMYVLRDFWAKQLEDERNASQQSQES